MVLKTATRAPAVWRSSNRVAMEGGITIKDGMATKDDATHGPDINASLIDTSNDLAR
jgi:hypothetical protein